MFVLSLLLLFHLLNASLFFVISILFDVLQYFVGTVIWHLTYVCNHKADRADEDITIKDREWRNVASWVLLYLKFLSALIAYFFILKFFIVQFKL